VVALKVALPELADDRDGLLEHLQAHVGLRPAIAEDVLVERLAAADAEPEPAGHERRRRRRGVRDDAGMRADRGARHRGHPAHLVGRLSERAEHGPHERALALLVVPRVKVIGDPGRAKPRLLGMAGVADDLAGGKLLAGEEDADLGHGGLPLPDSGARPTRP